MATTPTVYGSVGGRSTSALSVWIVAAIAYALGSLTAGFATLGMTLLGYAESPALSPGDLVTIITTRYVPHDELVVFAVSQGLAILVQAMWIVPRGRHAVLAPTFSLAMGWIVAVVMAPFAVDEALLLAVTAVVQILVLAAMIGRHRPRSGLQR